uniref:Conjugative plasmid protein (PARN3) n=1 Tax=Saccharolobus islandicus TaxID=43080 RepID=Q5W2W0_SACIS|nr:hypothetical protein [Sulfolobus islandicus]CAG38186.1 hypothetical protein [Sulfolobus islandicus]
MKKLSFNEIVVLNPLQTRYQLMTSRVLVPRYAATNDGIYRVNRAKRMKAFTVLMGVATGIAVLAFVTIIGILIIPPPSLISTLVGIGMIIGGVYGIVKLVRIGKRFGRIINDIEGELVIPWSQVKSIVVMNARQENVANRPSLTLNIIAPTYKEIGDWHVLTIDGKEIIIPDVDDPYNKLEYVKKRFNLNFS